MNWLNRKTDMVRLTTYTPMFEEAYNRGDKTAIDLGVIEIQDNPFRNGILRGT